MDLLQPLPTPPATRQILCQLFHYFTTSEPTWETIWTSFYFCFYFLLEADFF